MIKNFNYTNNFDKLIKIKEIVNCDVCEKGHDANSETFYTFYGNLMVGKSGGLVGNNFDEQGMLNRATVVCVEKCFMEIVRFDEIRAQNSLKKIKTTKDVPKDLNHSIPTILCDYSRDCRCRRCWPVSLDNRSMV